MRRQPNITNGANDLYDRQQPSKAGCAVVVEKDPGKLEERLKRGDWLTPGEVALLLQLGRTKVHTMLVQGQIRSRNKPASRHRVCNPEDVRRELAKLRDAEAETTAPASDTE
ncbi:hypothetical protein [Dactylosporangium sp. CA-139066]|uniref:hypothetical protein n=1 Tax=Dactylosporangium sp. CA-139066 TaxID=3239930 RepID=UPI003D91E4C9